MMERRIPLPEPISTIPFGDHGKLPTAFKAQAIAYCEQEGGPVLVGTPTKEAVIFFFPKGVVYDEIMLAAYGAPWDHYHKYTAEYIESQTCPA